MTAPIRHPPPAPLDCDPELLRIADYMMPAFPPRASDLGFLFGTRHGIPEFCRAAHALWRDGMFRRLLVSGGRTGGLARAEADIIGEELIRRARVLAEFHKIPGYLERGFLEELAESPVVDSADILA